MTDIERLPDWDDILPTPRPRLNLKQWAEEFRDVYKIAEALCKTPFVPKEMIGRQADVAATIMKGKELGLDPFDALGSIYIVHGRVGFYASFMRRRIVQAGHTLTIVESTETRCVIEGVRKDTGQKHRAQFTAEQARRAGIDLGKYPADKLIARATSRLCTQAFPDVLSGTLIAEDLIDGVIPTTPDDGVTDLVTATADPAIQSPPVQRRRATKPAKAARTQPKPAQKPPSEPDDELAELLGDTPQEPAAPEQQTLPVHPDAAPKTTPEEKGAEKPQPRREWQPGDPEPIEPIGMATSDAGAPPDEPATTPQNRKMHALFRELNLTERADRLTVTSHILGYDLTTSAGLTRNEARKLIDTLETWQLDHDYPVADRVNDILNTAALEAEKEGRDAE
jgi:hypothetical protein